MLLEIFLVHVAAMVSPGPNVLQVTRAAIAESRRTGLYVALGVATGSAIWAASAALGLALLLDRLTLLYDAARILGGVYLVYLGVQTLRSATAPLDVAGAGGMARSPARAWRLGVLTNLSNPKAVVFFGSIFAALVPQDASFGMRAAAVAVIVVDATAWHCLLALVFSTPRARAVYARAKRWLDRVAGTVMVGFGLEFAGSTALR